MENPQRVQKLLAEAGVCSRRKAEELIERGRVHINGTVATLGAKATYADDVRVDGKKIFFTERLYFLFNKPRGYLTTVRDPKGRKTIMALLPKHTRLFAVGRLDFDTEGLLLITNDGDFSQSIAHPSKEIKKTYLAELNREIVPSDLNRLKKGIRLKETFVKDIHAKKTGERTVTVTLHVGQKHVVKEIFKAIGYKVVHLKRTHIGNLGLGDLAVGKYRSLSSEEIKKIYQIPSWINHG